MQKVHFWLTRLQNSPYFCVFKYAQAVNPRVRLARFARVKLLRHALPISLLILRKKPPILQSTGWRASLKNIFV